MVSDILPIEGMFQALFQMSVKMAKPITQNPLYFPDDSELEVSVWRQTDDRKVWYEWLVEAYVMVGENKRKRLGMSEVGSSRKIGCLM